MIARLRELGKTIVLTTHYMEEAEVLADRVAVVVGGRIVALGTPAALGGRDRAPATIRFRLPAGVRVQDLPTAAVTCFVSTPITSRSQTPISRAWADLWTGRATTTAISPA